MNKFSFSALVLLTAFSCQRATYDNTMVSERPYAVVDETYHHKYGFEVAPDEWQSRGEHGQKVTVLNNGVTSVQNYHFGELDGESTFSFPYSSVVERVQTFSKGSLVADETRYLGNTPKKRLELLGNGKKRITHWYENGAPERIEELEGDKIITGNYYNLSHQSESQVVQGNGSRTNRDVFGQLLSRDTIENGEMIERMSFWPNGTPKEMLPYKGSIVHGLRRTFYIGGEPNTVEQWQDGVQTGITVVYQNGEKYAEVPYLNGTKSGLEKRYRDGTQLFEEISWVDGQEKGPSRTYKPTR